jgi:hypothetical protein
VYAYIVLKEGGITMRNVTLSLDDDLLKAGREYARKNNTTLNSLVRKLLAHSVTNPARGWLEECFVLMDRAKANSRGKKWSREDLYDV